MAKSTFAQRALWGARQCACKQRRSNTCASGEPTIHKYAHKAGPRLMQAASPPHTSASNIIRRQH
eukprot:12502183-Alexandrium_andersonii.AAC.1